MSRRRGRPRRSTGPAGAGDLAHYQPGTRPVIVRIGGVRCGPLLDGPSLDLTFLLPAHERIFAHVAERGRPVFFHPNEPSAERLRLMSSLSRHCELALTVGSEANIVGIREQIGDGVCLMGNVHCLATLRDGAPDTVRAEVEGIVDGVSRRGGHILNTCATMAFDTPPENAVAMVRTARSRFSSAIPAPTESAGPPPR